MRVLQRERVVSSGAAFRFIAVLTVAAVVVGGSAMALIDTKDVPSTWDGIWWAVVTVTTVGYGDIQVKSVDGRIVAMVVMLVGIGFLSVLTASIASVFVKTDRGDETESILTALSELRGEIAELKQRLPSS
jgi:voltage-gated potassium channel